MAMNRGRDSLSHCSDGKMALDGVVDGLNYQAEQAVALRYGELEAL